MAKRILVLDTPAGDLQDLAEAFTPRTEAGACEVHRVVSARELWDKLASALGWDLHNAEGYAEAYRDVILGDSLRVDATDRQIDRPVYQL